MKRKKIGIVIIVIVTVAAAGLIGTTVSCENPIVEILARDLSNPDIVIRAGDTIIDPTDGSYIFTANSEGVIEDVIFTIINQGSGILQLSSAPVEITGNDLDFFSLQHQPEELSLGAGSETDFIVSFTAVDKRTYSAEIRIASNDPDVGEYVFKIQATIGPEIQVFRGSTEIDLSGGNDNLGTIYYEDSNTVTYTIKNSGTASLELTGSAPVSASGAGAASINTGQPATSLSPGESMNFTLEIEPINLGFLSAQITIYSNDEDEENAFFNISFEAFIAIPETGLTSCAGGGYHSLALKNDGTVWSWGYDGDGQLGDNEVSQNSGSPVQVADLSDITDIGAGTMHSCALKSDGTVWSWGDNEYGQLGDGGVSGTESMVPVQVSDLTDIVAVAAGSYHSAALKKDGTVWCWGYNYYGQLGNGNAGSMAGSNTPVKVNGISDVVSITGGGNHTIAMKADGTVWCWGYNNNGQLGNTTTDNSSVPVQVIFSGGSPLGNIEEISAGNNHSIALRSDGTVWCWGDNEFGQLGDSNLPGDRYYPGQVPGLTNVLEIECGGDYSTALKNDGTVMSWGRNNEGQLGNGTSGLGTESDTPVQVIKADASPLTGVELITSGGSHALALKTDGTVMSWGNNNYGQLGEPSTIPSSKAVLVLERKELTDIAAGAEHSIALKGDGTVWCWGHNEYGQLGDGSTTDRKSPKRVPDLSNIIGIACGDYHSIAVRDDGTVWSWGRNNYGQLGDGTKVDSSTPVQVPGLSNITAVAGGFSFTLALKDDGTVWSWGWNAFGQLGDGQLSGMESIIPVQVTGLSEIVTIACGYAHSVARDSDQAVYTWGFNNYGQLGDGTTAQRYEPVEITGLTGVVSVAAGQNHTVVSRSDTTVWCWGWNSKGQLGDGTTTNRLSPVQVTGGFSSVDAVAAGDIHSIALKSDGTVWCWGSNWGRLGIDPVTANSDTPVQSEVISGAVKISGGEGHTMVLEDGSAWCWGYNHYGQLGDRTDSDRLTAVEALMIFTVQ